MNEEKETKELDGPTKVCATCGKSKPLSSFHRFATSPDGHRASCIDCYYAKNGYRRTTQIVLNGDTTGACNPELAGFKSRELIAELMARGYKGRLTFTNVIDLG